MTTLAGLPGLGAPLPTAKLVGAQNGAGGLFNLPDVAAMAVQTAYTAPYAGAVSRSVAGKLGDIISAADFGASPSASDNTLALQAWLDAIAGSGVRGFGRCGYLPPGMYKTGPLFIRRPCEVMGAGSHCTALDLLPGSVGPVLTISCAHDAGNYAFSYGDPVITVRGMQITGIKTDPNGIANGCDGINVATAAVNPVRPHIKLVDLHITGLPRAGLRSPIGWVGVVEAISCKFYNCGEELLWANTCNDWQFTNCLFGVAGRDNVLLSGVGQFIFTACNFFSAGRYNLQMFSSSGSGMNRFIGCSFDRAQQHGVFYNYAGGGHVVFEGCYFNTNGQSAANTYSDIFVNSAVSDGLVLDGCWFERTFTQDANLYTKHNIEFGGTNSTVHLDGGTEFQAGDIFTPGVTNAPTQIRGQWMAIEGSGTNAQGGDVVLSAGRGTGSARGGRFRVRSTFAGSSGTSANTPSDVLVASPESGLGVYAQAQFTGITLHAADATIVAQIKGWGAGNKTGVLQLYGADGTTVSTQIAPPGVGGGTRLSFGAYTFATLPAASANAGYTFRVTDRNQRLVTSDGTNWRDQTGAILT